MPKARKNTRKAPVTSLAPSDPASLPSGSSNHPQVTRTIIRRFHVLIKRQTRLQRTLQHGGAKKGTHDLTSAKAELEDIEREIDRLGGLAVYQRMSTIGQGKDRGGGSEKVLIGWLRELGIPEELKRKNTKLRSVIPQSSYPDSIHPGFNIASAQSSRSRRPETRQLHVLSGMDRCDPNRPPFTTLGHPRTGLFTHGSRGTPRKMGCDQSQSRSELCSRSKGPR